MFVSASGTATISVLLWIARKSLVWVTNKLARNAAVVDLNVIRYLDNKCITSSNLVLVVFVSASMKLYHRKEILTGKVCFFN